MSAVDSDPLADVLAELPEHVEVLGEGRFYTRCPTCERIGSAPSGNQPPVLYRTDERARAKMEARDHKEWHPNHFPQARGPDGEQIYG